MNDLISRGAAIDGILQFMPSALKEDATIGERVNFSAWQCAISCAESYVRTMPSAQLEIIRCKDCEWFRKEYGWNCIEYTVCGVSPTHHPIRTEEDFCSYAERRTDEAD